MIKKQRTIYEFTYYGICVFGLIFSIVEKNTPLTFSIISVTILLYVVFLLDKKLTEVNDRIKNLPTKETIKDVKMFMSENYKYKLNRDEKELYQNSFEDAIKYIYNKLRKENND